MANICSNSTIIYGPKEDVERFVKDIKAAFDKTEYKTLEKVFEALGCHMKESDVGAFNIDRASLYKDEKFDLKEKEGRWYVQLDYESAWSPAYEGIDAMLKELYPTLKQVTWAEEGGCQIFINTDDEGFFFPERFEVDASVCNKYTLDEGHALVVDREDALGVINHLHERAGLKKFDTLEEAEEWYEDEDNNPQPGCDFFLNINEYTNE